MIDYATLCQAIEDWRAGKRPATPPIPSASPDAVEEVDSDVVVLDDAEGQYAAPSGEGYEYEQQAQYDGQYAEAAPAAEGYEDYGEGVPAPVDGGTGTPPVGYEAAPFEPAAFDEGVPQAVEGGTGTPAVGVELVEPDGDQAQEYEDAGDGDPATQTYEAVDAEAVEEVEVDQDEEDATKAYPAAERDDDDEPT